ncbi:MAG: hypothetical protein WAS33_12105, partial [Candidatus Promineifilaceae bacterium]
LINSDEAYRQKMRDQILGATAADFVRFGEAVAALPKSENTVVTVLGSAEAMKTANAARGDDWLQVTKVL